MDIVEPLFVPHIWTIGIKRLPFLKKKEKKLKGLMEPDNILVEPLIKFCFYEFHHSICLFVFDRLCRRKWLYFSWYGFYFLFRFCPVLGCGQSTA